MGKVLVAVFVATAAVLLIGLASTAEAAEPLASALKAARPGAVIELDSQTGPHVEHVVVSGVHGKPGQPITVRGTKQARVVIRGRLQVTDAAFVVLEHLRIEPVPGDRTGEPLLSIEGEGIQLLDVEVVGGLADGMRLSGKDIVVRGGRVAACEGAGVVSRGSTRIDGLRVVSCRQAGLRTSGDAMVSNCLLLHNRGPALVADPNAAIRFYHNLVYDNGGGLMLDGCRSARVINNILVNNYPATLLGEDDVEISVRGEAQIDHNVYFRHPAKDKLLRGLPYAQGVDLGPLAADHPFGLRLRRDGRVMTSLAEKPWAGAYDVHSHYLDTLQRLTGRNQYTRSYEDLFVDFHQEDFRPRFTSPAVGRGMDLTAEAPADALGRPRSAKHPDIGPLAAPAEWWEDIDAGRAVIVDGNVPLDPQGRDRGLGTPDHPFATLAKAAALARSGSRIYVKDSIYRHSAMQTTFSLGPDSLLSGYPGHRPVFSPSEFIEPGRWEKVSPQGLHRLRDWHTFLGSNCRLNAWMLDFYGNARIGGPGENVTSLSRNAARAGEPFRPIRHLCLDRDTPQVLCDGVALQQAGGVLGLEEFPIGTMSAWGRDLSHLRPGSFMVGRRDFLVSKTVGRAPLADGQVFLEGPNPSPDMNYRIDGRATGYVSRFVARPGHTWHTVFTFPGGDRLWKLDPAVTAHFGEPHSRLLKDGWRRVAADKESACWVRQFALPAWELRIGHTATASGKGTVQFSPSENSDSPRLVRHPGPTPREKLPVGAWLQRQYQTGDPALAAVFDNPYQDYLEVRLAAGIDPNRQGLDVSCFSGRVEAIWRKAVEGTYNPGVNAPGLAMLSLFRTMEACEKPEATAATASQPWQFGFLVPLGETVPALLVRMPSAVDPNAEDPWKFTVVDDSLYVFLPGGESPDQHSIEAACNSTCYVPYVPGNNSTFFDWQDAGPLRPDMPAVRVYRTELAFSRNEHEPLWPEGAPEASSPGFELDPADPTGRTLHLLDDVRLDDAGQVLNLSGQTAVQPGQAGTPPREKILLFRYYEGGAAEGDSPIIAPRKLGHSPSPREHRVSSRTLGPDRRVVLPSKPAAFPSRYAMFVAPADQPASMIEQMHWPALRRAPSRQELSQGTYYYDAASHAFYVALFPGSEPAVSRWCGGRSDPFHTIRGLYCLGGNAYGHQKQYGWGAGLGAAADVFDDVSVGFSPGNNMPTVPGSVVRDCTFRWAGTDVGRGGEVSGDERHTANRIGRPELLVDHCTFDVSNSFLFDGNDNPTKNIPFANHHIWERNYFLSAMCGVQGPWWDQYGFNNVVQDCIFAGRGGVDVEVCENLIVRNNLFTTDKGMLVTFRGSDRAYAFNNTTFRGGGIWFFSSPERANATEQGTPCYGPSFPVIKRGPVSWLTIEPLRHEKGISLDVRWIALKDQPEVYYCENWDQASPLLIDGKGFASYRAVGSLTDMARGTWFHDAGARRLYIRLTDGSAPQSRAVPPPHIPQSEQVRRDLVYTLTVVRPGRLSIPHRALSKTELEILEPLKPGETVEVCYYEASGRRVERFPITVAMLTLGRPRLRLGAQPADDRLFVGRARQQPPLVRVTGSWTDVRPFDAELIPGASIVASELMGMEFHVLRDQFPEVKLGDQFESVFHSRSVYHMACLDNVFLDMRSSVACDRMDNPHHGANFLVQSEHADPSHSRIDYNCYWKDLQAAPGPLSAWVHWGRQQVWNPTSAKEGLTLGEFQEKTGYEAHGLMPASYFTLVCNPLRFDFRPLPDSPLLGAGTATRQQVGAFLFDPDETNGGRRFTYKGNERDMLGQPRGDRPTLGAIQGPLPGAQAYYVSPQGKDSAERGSRAQPFATFAYALARMLPGDVLVVLAGTYREPLVVNRSGTARDFLHIVAEYPPYPAPPKFPAGGPSAIDASALGDRPAVLLDGCAHVRVAGLRIVGSGAPAAVELRGARDCVVEYVFTDKCQHTGIRVTGRSNTLYECNVSGGATGYELAGSLIDVRWCAAGDNPTGFRTVGPVAGLLLLQNRHTGGKQAGFVIGGPASDVVLDGNWADSAQCGYHVAGSRVMLVNNIADHTRNGIAVVDGSDVRIFNNSLLRCVEDGLVLGDRIGSALVLNNLVQADARHIRMGRVLTLPARDGKSVNASGAVVWSDYNVYSRATLPLQLKAAIGSETAEGLAAWRQISGLDRNSRLAPLVYQKIQDINGHWRIRQHSISVSNLTPHFNVGPLGANAWPYAGGGTFVLDLPENWKPVGDPARRLWCFDTLPGEGALAARAHWYTARLDYRRTDGTRAQRDLYRLDLPPEQIPPGSFCQDAATARVYVRVPDDADESCPIGVHRKRAPKQAVGYYVGRAPAGPAEKYQGKLITPSLAAAMEKEGIREADAVANVLSCLCGTPTLEQGCPILGLARDADSMPRPTAPGPMCSSGCWNGPGRFDVGAAEHGYFVP